MKFYIQVIAGLVFLTLAIFCITYASLGSQHQKDWIFWGVIAAINFNTGILFVISATVHKVKDELLKKQRSRRYTENAVRD